MSDPDLTVRWGPRPHPQLLRGPRHRWWRPLVGLAVAVAGVGVLFGVVIVGSLAASVALGRQPTEADLTSSPVAFLANNLLLAALVPLAWLAVLAGHGIRPRWVASVTGGIRWRWLVASAWLPLLALVVGIGGLALLSVAEGEQPFGDGDGSSRSTVVLLLAVVLLTTPLQAAGEEYLFRGWLSQAVGSWFRRAGVGAVVAALVSASLFGLAHGDQDPWLFADRFLFGLTASYLAWRTGGLETGIAFHALNNIVVLVPTVLAGGLDDALASTSASPLLVGVDVAVMAVVALGTAWHARRRGLARLSVPPRVQSPAGAVAAAGADPVT